MEQEEVLYSEEFIKLLTKRLILLGGYLNEFFEILDIPYEDYEYDFFIKRTAERLIILIVKSASDINGLILSEFDQEPAKTEYESFMKIADLNLITYDILPDLLSSVGLRNKLIRQYGMYEDDEIYSMLNQIFEAYNSYFREIKDYFYVED